MGRLTVFYLLISSAAAIAAQEPTREAPAVSVAVSVTSRSNERITGLTAADFRVVEDEREQAIVSASEGPGPISVAVVVDSSDTTAGVLQQLAQHAVERLVAGLGPDDEIALLTYDRQIKVAVPWTAAASFPKLEWTPWKTMPFTDVLQGIYQALGLMNEAKNARVAVVVISSADQIGSKYGLRDFVRNRRESEAGIYGLRTADLLSTGAGVGGPRPGPTGTGTTIWDSRGALVSFDDLVRDSGGLVLPGRNATEVERSVTALVSNIRHQYILKYVSRAPADGAYRRLKVEVRRDGARLRYRTGVRS